MDAAASHDGERRRAVKCYAFDIDRDGKCHVYEGLCSRRKHLATLARGIIIDIDDANAYVRYHFAEKCEACNGAGFVASSELDGMPPELRIVVAQTEPPCEACSRTGRKPTDFSMSFIDRSKPSKPMSDEDAREFVLAKILNDHQPGGACYVEPIYDEHAEALRDDDRRRG